MEGKESSKQQPPSSHRASEEGPQRIIDQGTTDPQTAPFAPSPSSTASESVLNRPRHRPSPFFGGYRKEAQLASNVSSRGGNFGGQSRATTPVGPTLEQSQSTLSSLPTPPGASADLATARSGESSPPFHPLAQVTGRPNNEQTPPRSKKRVVRPDDWWQKNKAAVPSDRSPLHPSVPTPRSAPVQSSAEFRKKAQQFESEEGQALRAELTPSPLRIRKFSVPTPERHCKFATTQKPFAASDSQAVLAVPALTRNLVLKKLLSVESFDELTKQSLAPEAESVEEAEKRIHRKNTLDILEGSPRESLEQLLKFGNPQSSTKVSKQPNSQTEMDSLHPESAAALTAHRREAIRLAHAQERAVLEKCKRSDQDVPGYTFDELIGKGSFGRVYKGRQTSTSKIVAIKVLDVDDADFRAYGEQKDEQIRDFNREIRILRQAQDSGAENLNPMIEALPVHSQLWLICEYCPGGSVKTLMRATNDRLSEKYITVVARELGKALKGLHDAGIMHRDVKAANVLIHEEGRLQLCDFGVATVLDTRTDKRRTFIGTLHWMPPELWTEKPEYSDEVDVWEYGCTLYECAVGRPPNSDLRERQQLKMRMRRLKQAISLPEQESFSEGLRSLVTYTLSPDVTSRPSMKDVLQHEFLADTEETHPTSSLTELVKTYYAWLFGGGQRVSLFMPGGAAAAATEDPDAEIRQSDEWNFSMTQDFERRVSEILEIPDLSDFSTADDMEGEETPKGPKITTLSPPREMTVAQKANFEARVKRGADLSNLFDQAKPVYEYKTKTDFVPVPEQRRISDLPFRAMAEDRPSSIASNVIDLGDFDEADYAIAAPRTDDKIQTAYAGTPIKEETIRLADAATLRQKRADSKGPRESSTQASLTARRASSADDAESRSGGVAAQDFAMSQQDWTVKEKNKGPELQEAAEITTGKRGHATMDWSFAKAMAGAPYTDEPATTDDPQGSDEPTALEEKARKHATLEWSFSNAMAEASAAGTLETSVSQSRPAPGRPVPLLRQMTMPVTSGDFRDVDDPPRPSTALSEAYSESSQSSADVDPFALEHAHDIYPDPAALDEVGMSSYYTGRGRTMVGEQHPQTRAGTYNINNPTIPGSTVAPYALGRPPRIGDDAFPGPSQAQNANQLMPTGAIRRHANNGSSSTNSSSAAARPTVEVPDATPPSIAAMSSAATNEEIEAELTRMLEGMQGTLHAASQAVQSRRRRGRARSGRPSSSEWEDEE